MKRKSHFHGWWTEERTEQLIRLWPEGHSASQLAKIMKAPSRNTIIGKAARLGLPSHKKSTITKVARAPRRHGRPSRLTVFQYTQESLPPIPVETTVISIHEVYPRIDGLPDALLRRHPNQCVFPIGETISPEFHYCTNAKGSHSNYCDAHFRVSHPPALERERVHRRAEKQLFKLNATYQAEAWNKAVRQRSPALIFRICIGNNA